MSERSAVQNPMLKYASEIGWQYISPEVASMARLGDTGYYLTDVLREQLINLNRGVVDTGRANEIIRRLNLLYPSIEGNRDALSYLRGEQSVFVPDENRQRNFSLIDFEIRVTISFTLQMNGDKKAWPSPTELMLFF